MLRVIEFAFTGYSITDVARSRDFYENALNLTPATILDRNGKGWIEYEIGPHVLAISNMNEEWKASPNGGVLALEVEDFDAAIAAHALASGAKLVTANLDHMARVPGLQIEDWSQ